MNDLAIEEVDGGVVFSAKVVPGSSRTALGGLLKGMLKIKVSAAPEKGKANKCLVAFLADELGVKNKNISIISGSTKPVKQIMVSGMSAESLLNKLNSHQQGPAND
jgi:uncharacterized protein (TIGR00251 family)